MQKLKMHSPDMTQEHIARIRELFPNCVTEARGKDGSLRLSVDFDLLRQELSGSIVEGPQERYHLDWPGKREAMLAANAPIAKALRPCREESVDFDTTKNLFIEGDNLDALKLLQETYLGKVKMIYIDPPYNTGHDFVYKDSFQDSIENYKEQAGLSGQSNADTSGRYHSDWLSMMYPRLRLARELMSNDGVIFISIDDNEAKNLRSLCDEIFGESNFKSDISWQKRYTRSNNTIDFTTVIEHIFVYAKGESFQVNLLPRSEESDEGYTNPDNDPNGAWITSSYVNPATKEQRPNLSYEIIAPDGRKVTHPTNAWKYAKEEYERHRDEGRLWWGADESAPYPRKKIYLSEARGMTPINFFNTNMLEAQMMVVKKLRSFSVVSILTSRSRHY